MASSSLSPAVTIKEIDLTTTVSAVSSSNGAIAGEFEWGPVLDVTAVSSEAALVNRFGKPNDSTFSNFFVAADFLAYSSNLSVVRIDTTAAVNAVATGTAIKIRNQNDYDLNNSGGANAVGMAAAKYPGSKGNSLSVAFADAATFSRSMAGTIAVTADSNVLTGTSTSFLQELEIGSYVELVVSGTRYTKKVTQISSDVLAQVDSVYPATGTGITGTAKWQYYQLFSAAPVDSNKAVANGATGDGLHIVVVDTNGKFSGSKNTVLERFENVSKASDGMRYDGTSGFYKTVLNSSAYVWWMDHPVSSQVTLTGLEFGAATATGAYKNFKKPVTLLLTSGVDGFGATTGDSQTAFSIFSNSEKYDISLIMSGKANATLAQYIISSVAEPRMDCVAFVSPVDPISGDPIIGDTAEAIEKLKDFRTSVSASSSYGFMDSGYKYRYDKYNDVYRWVPMNGDMAGLCARTDYVAEAWYSPAGLNRGQLKNVTKLAINPDKTMRDSLFAVGINPVVTFPGQGTVLFGDKTMLLRPSAFDAINVRRLFILIEKAISLFSKSFLFELNTPLNRQLFAAKISSYLRDIQGREGIIEFFVDVGDSVNTAEVIDANELRANIFIKPSRSIRTIQLNFIATSTGASFSEVQVVNG